MNETDRIRSEYERRDESPEIMDFWSQPSPQLECLRQQRLRAMRDPLLLALSARTRPLRVLEIGVGRGEFLEQVLALELGSCEVHGIDLSASRIEVAGQSHPSWRLTVGSASELPLGTGTVDLVLQSTMLSSVLDDECRKAIMAEASRVLSTGGVFLWYDLRPIPPLLRVCYAWVERVWKPVMRTVKGQDARTATRHTASVLPESPSRLKRISADEIVSLLQGFDILHRRATTLPLEMCQYTSGVGRFLADTLESSRVLNTHWLVLARKR